MRLLTKTHRRPRALVFLAFLAFNVEAATHYVDLNSTNPVAPYSDWSTAATNIQGAIDVSTDGDLVLVNDGVYQTGGEVVYGSLTNRVVISKAITVQSVNGPAATVIQGYQDTNTINGDDAVRCVYLSDGAVLSGFTLTNGATEIDQDESWDYTLYTGGGVFCDATNVVVTNCVITACSASDAGGGAEGRSTFLEAGGGTFLSCAFTGNQCVASAGADQCVLSNCTLTGNTSGYGGGASASMLINCTVANNSATAGGQGTGGGVEFCTLVGCTLETNFSDIGGGAWGNSENPCTLSNCTLICNSTSSDGGGASGCTLNHCTLTGNSAANNGGGAESGTLNNCTLDGNSAYYNGGGADSSTLCNCLLTNNAVLQWNGGGVSGSTLNDCTLSGNLAGQAGGGAIDSMLTNCMLIGNAVAGYGGGGGGAYGSELDRCTLIGNTATSNGAGTGGGACFCTVNNSLFTGNFADQSGGGAMYGTLNNCSVVGNSAALSGGGAGDCDMNNCIVYYNTAPESDNFVLDGEVSGTLNYCCIPDMPPPANGTGNITNEPQLADVAHISADSPCIGAGSANYSTGADLDGQPWLNPPSIGCNEYYAGSATGPLSVAIQADYTNVIPRFSVNFSGSIAGHASYNVWDFGDGTTASNELSASHSWAAAGNYAVAFTAYNDSNPGGISATVVVCVTTQQVWYVDAGSTNPVAPFETWSTAAADIQDAVDAAVPGGTVLVTNGVYATGGRVVYGLLTNRVVIGKPLTVQSVNGPAATLIEGYQDTNSILADDAVRCVYLANNAVLSGFTLTNGATRAAGDGNLEQSGGGVWCQSTNAAITNCVFTANVANDAGGGVEQGTLSDCTLTSNSVVAFYCSGGGADNSVLNNCELTGNLSGGFITGPDAAETSSIKEAKQSGPRPRVVVDWYGGGAANSTLNDCTLVGNQSNGGGGGADFSTLDNCIITGNSAGYGGGAENSTLNDCTVTGNAISYGGFNAGGTQDSTVNNSIVYYNTNGGDYGNCTMNYCCTAQPPGGFGNITNEPCFVNWTNNDFHLQSNSPCINSGDNTYVTTANDFDGNPRIVGGTVDIGAYEYQTPSSVLSYAWAQQYGLPTDGSMDYADLDGTGMNNWQKWIAGLNPTNPASVLAMLPPAATNNAGGITVSWESVGNRAYLLQRSCDLTAPPVFSTIQTDIIGQTGTTSYTDTSATNSTPYFYRVGIQ